MGNITFIEHDGTQHPVELEAGKSLMQIAMDWLLADGPRTLWVGVWNENFGAQRFYARYGFEKAGDYLFPVGRTNDHEFIFRRAA